MTKETKTTYCRVCHAACPLEVDLDDGRVVAVRGVDDDPIFEGYTCIKGRQLPDQIHHPERILYPMRRDGGEFVRIDSEVALDEIATKLRSIIDEHGPRAVASYSGTGAYQNAAGVETARGWHKGLDSPSFYTSVTIDQPSKSTAPGIIGAWHGGWHNFSDADVSMAIGYNPMVSSYAAVGGLQGTNPFVVMRRAKERGMKLIVVDPRVTELASFADIHLQIRPGQDAALLSAMIRTILDEELHDQDFCDAWVGDLDALRVAVDLFTPDGVAERCGVDADKIVDAARMFAAGPRGTAGTGTGPNMAPNPSLAEHLTIALNVICGRVNREGDKWESGMFFYPDSEPKAQPVAPRDVRTGAHHRVRGLRGFRGEMLASALSDEILEPGEGQVRALIVSGGNPAVAFPDQELTMRALRNLELLVVVDHRMTATTELADYVLAPTLSLERADVPHLMDRWFREPYTNYTPAVMDKPGDVLNEWEVFHGLAKRLGTSILVRNGDIMSIDNPTDDDVLDMLWDGGRMPMAVVRENRGVSHPDRAQVVGPADPDCAARFATAPAIVQGWMQDLIESSAVDRIDVPEGDGEKMLLVSRRLKDVLNSLGPELPGIARRGTTNKAYMHPTSLERLGVAEGDLVHIASKHGALTGVCASAPDVREGVISMAHSWGDGSLEDGRVRQIGTPTSRLTSAAADYDEIHGMPVQSAIPVRARPAPVAATV